MNIEMTINAIGELANEFKNKTKVERFHLYSSVKTFYDELEGYAKKAEQRGKPIPNVELYLGELLMRLRCLAHIEVSYQDDITNMVFLQEVIEKLRSVNCFNLQCIHPDSFNEDENAGAHGSYVGSTNKPTRVVMEESN